jgi:hypothetical protein
MCERTLDVQSRLDEAVDRLTGRIRMELFVMKSASVSRIPKPRCAGNRDDLIFSGLSHGS